MLLHGREHRKKVWASAALNILLFLYAFMFTRYYNLLYDTIAGKLFWVS